MGYERKITEKERKKDRGEKNTPAYEFPHAREKSLEKSIFP